MVGSSTVCTCSCACEDGDLRVDMAPHMGMCKEVACGRGNCVCACVCVRVGGGDSCEGMSFSLHRVLDGS